MLEFVLRHSFTLAPHCVPWHRPPGQVWRSAGVRGKFVDGLKKTKSCSLVVSEILDLELLLQNALI
jgi:hypothetical protein